ncbi:MAG: ATP-binding domain-containing protein, partial [Firmicutes bacterium]|nr:ATP-binding domain-containing protein [Bacillota bacterium]
ARRVGGEASDEETGVFNGEIGRVVAVWPERRLVHVQFEDGRVIEYDDQRIWQLQLAYAITVHKSQGNEFACVVMPVVWTMPALMTRNLLYTALTRGRRLVVLVGDRRAVGAYIRNASVAARHSGLAARIAS